MCSLDLLAEITQRGCQMSTLGPEVHGEVHLPGNRRASRRQKAKIECERGELAKVRGALGMTGSLQREEQ